MQNPESFFRRVLHLAEQWPVIQRLIDAAVDGSYRCGRGERDRVTEDEIMGHQYQSDRGHSASFERWETEHHCSGDARDILIPEYGGAKEIFYRGQFPCFKYRQFEPQCLLQNPVAHPVRRSDFVLRKVHRGETKISGDTGILVTLLIGRTRMRQLLTVILGYVQILGHILTAWVRHQADVQDHL